MIRVALVAVLLCAGCIGATTPSAGPVEQRAPGTWTTRAPAPVARQEVAVAAHDGHVWVMGGFDARAAPDSKVESYDPLTDTWHERPPLPVALHHAAAAAADGRLFVIGGYTGSRLRWTPLATVYELVGQRWEQRASLLTARGGLAAAVLDGRVHALGGSGRGVSGAHEVYDARTDRWRGASAIRLKRRRSSTPEIWS